MFYFYCLALKGEWQLNKSTEKIAFLDSGEPEMIFWLNFLTLKFWQPSLNELEFALAELGQALSTEDEMIFSKWLWFFFSFVYC